MTKPVFFIDNVTDLAKVVQPILDRASASGVVLFQGEIGAGKTTLIQQLCAHLGVKESVTSPTFSLVNEYHFPKVSGAIGRIFHLDLYRLNGFEELEGIGFEDYLYEGDYCFIEWPEIAKSLIPEGALWLQLEHQPDSRRKILFL